MPTNLKRQVVIYGIGYNCHLGHGSRIVEWIAGLWGATGVWSLVMTEFAQ